MRRSAVGSVSEPMDQICLTGDPEAEQRERFRNALYHGGIDGANMREALEIRNIKLVVSIVDDAARLEHFDGIAYWRSPSIRDLPNDASAALLESFINDVHMRIAAELSRGHSVLVHCIMGMSRSATVVTGYVMKELGLKRDEALELVRRSRRIARPNPGFLKLLDRLEPQMSAKKVFSGHQRVGCFPTCCMAGLQFPLSR